MGHPPVGPTPATRLNRSLPSGAPPDSHVKATRDVSKRTRRTRTMSAGGSVLISFPDADQLHPARDVAVIKQPVSGLPNHGSFTDNFIDLPFDLSHAGRFGARITITESQT